MCFLEIIAARLMNFVVSMFIRMIVTIILLSLVILKMDLQLYMQTNKATKNIWLSALAVLIGFLVERL